MLPQENISRIRVNETKTKRKSSSLLGNLVTSLNFGIVLHFELLRNILKEKINKLLSNVKD